MLADCEEMPRELVVRQAFGWAETYVLVSCRALGKSRFGIKRRGVSRRIRGLGAGLGEAEADSEDGPLRNVAVEMRIGA